MTSGSQPEVWPTRHCSLMRNPGRSATRPGEAEGNGREHRYRRSHDIEIPTKWEISHQPGIKSPLAHEVVGPVPPRRGSRASRLGWIVEPTASDLYAEQHDAVVGHELSDDDCCCDEDATDDHDAVVGTIGIDHGKCVEVLGELVDDWWQIDHDEIGTRWLSIRPSVAAELVVEILEEGVVDADASAIRHRSGVGASWLDAMCDSILRRERASRSGDRLPRSASIPSRTIAWRSAGLMFSSSSADQIFGDTISGRYQCRLV